MFLKLSVHAGEGKWNEAARQAARDRARRVSGIMMKSVDFVPMSLRDRDLWDGLKQSRGSETFVHCRAERV